MNLPKYLLCSLLLIHWSACVEPPPPKVEIRHNYIILLDLSDRIIKEKDQVDRDKELIKNLYGVFEQKVRQQLYIRSKDCIRVVIAPQAGSPVHNEDLENRLYVNMGTIPLKDRKPKEAERRDQFAAAVDDLYNQADFSQRPGDFKGADIVRYFDQDIKNDLISDPDTRNYVFLITDGYMYVSGKQASLSGWRTLPRRYANLSVMLLELDPLDRDGEWDQMQSAWKKWLQGMQIHNIAFEKRSALKKIAENIGKFIQDGGEEDLESENIGRNEPLPDGGHTTEVRYPQPLASPDPGATGEKALSKHPESKGDLVNPSDIMQSTGDETLPGLAEWQLLINGEHNPLDAVTQVNVFDQLELKSPYRGVLLYQFGDDPHFTNANLHVFKEPGKYTLSIKTPAGKQLLNRTISVLGTPGSVTTAFQLFAELKKHNADKESVSAFSTRLLRVCDNDQVPVDLYLHNQSKLSILLKDFLRQLQTSKGPVFSEVSQISSNPNTGKVNRIELKE